MRTVHLVFILLVIAAVSLLSCKTQQGYVKESKSDTIFVSRRDAVYDSVFVDRFRNVYVKGDTVHDDVILTEYKYLYRDRTDTVYEKNTETVEKRVVEKVSERSGYDRFVSWGFWILVVLILICIVWWIIKKIYLRR